LLSRFATLSGRRSAPGLPFRLGRRDLKNDGRGLPARFGWRQIFRSGAGVGGERIQIRCENPICYSKLAGLVAQFFNVLVKGLTEFVGGGAKDGFVLSGKENLA
jgi:hypothetical protein